MSEAGVGVLLFRRQTSDGPLLTCKFYVTQSVIVRPERVILAFCSWCLPRRSAVCTSYLTTGKPSLSLDFAKPFVPQLGI